MRSSEDQLANDDVQAAWTYHERTKHSPASVRASGHRLDWDNQPRPYKLYRDVSAISLPGERPVAPVSAFDVLLGGHTAGGRADQIDFPTLATLLHYSTGITKRLRYPGGVMDFRAASCTGALYHIEVYLVCRDLPGLEAGVYQFGVHDAALRRLRRGDLRGAVVDATASSREVAGAPVVLVFTSTYWRNAWKYQDRTYRHCFWDLGTILANLFTMAAAHGVPASVHLGFVDAEVNRLIDVDGEGEAALAIVALGARGASTPPTPAVPSLHLDTVPLSPREIDFPAIRAMHAAASLHSQAEVAAWRVAAERCFWPPTPAEAPGTAAQLPTLGQAELPGHSVEEVILRRGSARSFREEPIRGDQLGTLLRCAAGEIPADVPFGLSHGWNTGYVIANAVDGLQSGKYALESSARALALLEAGDFRDHAGRLALWQRLGADAAVDVYFLADLHRALDCMGNRGYRAAQLEAAIIAGRLYLAAYGLGLGATGLTFFDDAVVEFFGPHAEGKSVMFLIALGRPAVPPRRGP
ncbi:MAG TPA: SagB/ThcOx family dehydrogenase [Chloroflexota bacterium]|nr:SagB/ThcOx family dehydrogenase [Chloroflexota bacterium]